MPKNKWPGIDTACMAAERVKRAVDRVEGVVIAALTVFDNGWRGAQPCRYRLGARFCRFVGSALFCARLVLDKWFAERKVKYLHARADSTLKDAWGLLEESDCLGKGSPCHANASSWRSRPSARGAEHCPYVRTGWSAL
jgi:hypothetical protein